MHEVLLNIPQTAVGAIESAHPDIQAKLLPTYEAVLQVHDSVLSSLAQNRITEGEVISFLHDPRGITLTEGASIGVYGRDIRRLAHQYEHVRKVMGATLELKRTLIELHAPESIVAYQTGTGWPLPLENESCTRIGFIHYGTGALAEYAPPGTLADEEAGMHIYKVRGKRGGERTLLALYRRIHGYTETNWETAPHDLAFMPRLLKGVETKFILSSFASGVDPTIVRKGAVKVGDLAVIVGSGDESKLSNILGPTTGDQRIFARLFGGAFQNIAAMRPTRGAVKLLHETMEELNGLSPGKDMPALHPTIQVDTGRTPNFQDAYSHAVPHSVYNEMIARGTLPADILKLFRPKFDIRNLFSQQTVALVHGMVQLIERDGYYQHSDSGLQLPWNRVLEELPVVSYTDESDPDREGQSHKISDDKVVEAGKRMGPYTSRLVTSFFSKQADVALLN